MRACFLGQNICALGYGVALVQTVPADSSPEPHTLSEAAPTNVPAPNRMFAALHQQFMDINAPPDMIITHRQFLSPRQS